MKLERIMACALLCDRSRAVHALRNAESRHPCRSEAVSDLRSSQGEPPYVSAANQICLCIQSIKMAEERVHLWASQPAIVTLLLLLNKDVCQRTMLQHENGTHHALLELLRLLLSLSRFTQLLRVRRPSSTFAECDCYSFRACSDVTAHVQSIRRSKGEVALFSFSLSILRGKFQVCAFQSHTHSYSPDIWCPCLDSFSFLSYFFFFVLVFSLCFLLCCCCCSHSWCFLACTFPPRRHSFISLSSIISPHSMDVIQQG